MPWTGAGYPSLKPTEWDGSELDEEQTRTLVQLMADVGSAMNAAGDATTYIRRSLERIGYVYGLRNLGVFVVPTLLLLRYGADRVTFVDLSSRPLDLRLDQVSDIYRLVDEVEQGNVGPAEGLTRLQEALHKPPRFGWLAAVVGMALIAAGIALVLRPSAGELLLAIALGIVVGLVKGALGRWPPIWPLVPAASGLVVAAIALVLAEEAFDVRPLRVVIPALATFLPGAALTVAMIELSNGDLIAGGSRLAYSAARLLLLVFGVVVAVEWIGVPRTAVAPETIGFPAIAGAIGVVAFTSGVYLHYSAPPGSWPWLLVVVAAAWTAQQVASQFLGGQMGGFFGGVVMVVASTLVQSRSGAPPMIVSYTPAFWLLVPGAVGFEGLAQLVNEDPAAGIDDLVTMAITMVSIALGMLFGLLLAGRRRAFEVV